MDKIDGFYTATQTVMRDLRERGQDVGQTIAEYSEVRYGPDLPDDVFTERYLRKPPREYLK